MQPLISLIHLLEYDRMMANSVTRTQGYAEMISMDTIIGRWTTANICACIFSAENMIIIERMIEK